MRGLQRILPLAPGSGSRMGNDCWKPTGAPDREQSAKPRRSERQACCSSWQVVLWGMVFIPMPEETTAEDSAGSAMVRFACWEDHSRNRRQWAEVMHIKYEMFN